MKSPLAPKVACSRKPAVMADFHHRLRQALLATPSGNEERGSLLASRRAPKYSAENGPLSNRCSQSRGIPPYHALGRPKRRQSPRSCFSVTTHDTTHGHRFLAHDNPTRLISNGETLRKVVGARGFEPPTLRSRTVRATKLRHAPYLIQRQIVA